MEYGDLHTHTSCSDGALHPRDHVAHVLELKASPERREQEAARRGFTLSLNDHRTLKNLSVLSVTDHDTLLGIEDILLASRSSGLSIIPGFEATTSTTLRCGQYSLHVLVYVHPKTSCNIAVLQARDQATFIEALLKSYGDTIHNLQAGNNARYQKLRERASLHYFMPTTPTELHEVASARLTDTTCILGSWRDYGLVYSWTDVAQLFINKGAMRSLEEGRLLTRRDGPLYVPYTLEKNSVETEQFLEECKRIKANTTLNILVGIAHPLAQVRAIMRAQHGEEYVHHSPECAYNDIIAMLRQWHNAGFIDFIEADYPRYTKPADESYNRRETQFTSKLSKDLKNFCRAQDIPWSGGSDFHGTPDTGLVGIGFGDVHYGGRELKKITSQLWE